MSRADEALRECARELSEYAQANGGDPSKARDLVIASIKRLLECPDLIGIGLPRVAQHLESTRILYYDTQVQMTLGRGRAGLYDPPHNHGAWLATAVYKQGEVQYADYRRMDDQSRAGHADLKVADARILRPGDVAITPPPPHDIHENRTLAESYMLVITGGSFAPTREYYDVGAKTYFTKAESTKDKSEQPAAQGAGK